MAQTLDFLPSLPTAISPVLSCGMAMLLSAAIADKLFRTSRIPRAATYVVLGMVFGTSGLNWISPDMAGTWRPFVDVALGAVLFQLGQRLDLMWLRYNKWLAATSLLDVVVTFSVVFWVMMQTRMGAVSSALIAIVAVSTSPAVTICLTMEAQSRGQVTERLLLLTGLNTIFTLLLAQIWIGWGHLELANHPFAAVFHPLYVLFGSTLVGLVIAKAYGFLARFLSQRQDVSLAHLALVLVAVQTAYLLKVSPFLSLLGAGLMYRTCAKEGTRPGGEYDPLLYPLQAFLFLAVGASISLQGWLVAVPALAVLVVSRGLVKIGVALIFSRPTGLAFRQGLGLGFGLLPMSALACVLAIDASALFPAFDSRARAMLLGMIAVFQLIGPILVRLGLNRLSGECHPMQ